MRKGVNVKRYKTPILFRDFIIKLLDLQNKLHP